MKEPIRYDIICSLTINPNGSYVTYEDYEKLKYRLEYVLTLVKKQSEDEKNTSQEKDSSSEGK